MDKAISKTKVLWLLIGNAVFGLSQWVLLMLLAKLTNPASVGQFALGLAVSAPIVLFTNMRLRLIQTADTLDHYKFKHYLGLRLISSTIAVLVIAIVASSGVFSLAVAAVVMVVGLTKIIDSISDITYGYFQKHERLEFVGASLVTRATVSVLLFGLTLMISRSVVYSTLAVAAGWLVLLFLFDVRCQRSLQKQVDFPRETRSARGASATLSKIFEGGTISRLTRAAIPLGFVALLGSLSVNVPRYFIEWHLGEEYLGVYAGMAYIGTAGALVVTSIGQPLLVRLSKLYSSREFSRFMRSYLKLSAAVVLLGASGIIVAATFGDAVLAFFYTPAFAKYPLVFTFLMVAATSYYLVLCQWYALTASGQFAVQIALSLLTLLVIGASCFVLVPEMGLKGAALSEIAGYVTHFLLGLLVLHHGSLRHKRNR